MDRITVTTRTEEPDHDDHHDDSQRQQLLNSYFTDLFQTFSLSNENAVELCMDNAASHKLRERRSRRSFGAPNRWNSSDEMHDFLDSFSIPTPLAQQQQQKSSSDSELRTRNNRNNQSNSYNNSSFKSLPQLPCRQKSPAPVKPKLTSDNCIFSPQKPLSANAAACAALSALLRCPLQRSSSMPNLDVSNHNNDSTTADPPRMPRRSSDDDLCSSPSSSSLSMSLLQAIPAAPELEDDATDGYKGDDSSSSMLSFASYSPSGRCYTFVLNQQQQQQLTQQEKTQEQQYNSSQSSSSSGLSFRDYDISPSSGSSSLATFSKHSCSYNIGTTSTNLTGDAAARQMWHFQHSAMNDDATTKPHLQFASPVEKNNLLASCSAGTSLLAGQETSMISLKELHARCMARRRKLLQEQKLSSSSSSGMTNSPTRASTALARSQFLLTMPIRRDSSSSMNSNNNNGSGKQQQLKKTASFALGAAAGATTSPSAAASASRLQQNTIGAGGCGGRGGVKQGLW